MLALLTLANSICSCVKISLTSGLHVIPHRAIVHKPFMARHKGHISDTYEIDEGEKKTASGGKTASSGRQRQAKRLSEAETTAAAGWKERELHSNTDSSDL